MLKTTFSASLTSSRAAVAVSSGSDGLLRNRKGSHFLSRFSGVNANEWRNWDHFLGCYPLCDSRRGPFATTAIPAWGIALPHFNPNQTLLPVSGWIYIRFLGIRMELQRPPSPSFFHSTLEESASDFVNECMIFLK